ncbi:Phospholipase/carboxylesterase/thioesterase [Zychaea mexicana]|uniref:Phospholipase/carboxylesterase/thioesterase n=1 Tax=Zychaea mexicana TaxID=64656 RepID=UPI0022FEF745|nr:Phospholipase/carboxylesterase/thioesterase [Zychaea mexicana]KAI9489413.1 Phospholipase/carboxylesterase/thioesterase [Zychaea mexicana]
MASALTSVVVNAKAKHTATVLFLHGLGDSGSGWSFLAEELSGLFPHIKWVLPNAPMLPITLNQGMRMPAWFDLNGLDRAITANQDEKGLLASSVAVNSLIRKEIDSGIPSERIVIGGFSQGCALSLLVGLTSEYKFGGVVGCSGWLPLAEKFPAMASDANKKTPVMMCHGDADPVVKYSFGRDSAGLLEKLGYNVKFNTYPGLVHSASPQELQDIASFIKERLPPVEA